MNKDLLLASNRKSDRSFAEAVAESAGLSLEQVADPKEAAQLIGEGKAASVFIDLDEPEIISQIEARLAEKVGLFSDQINSNLIHFLSDRDFQQASVPVHSPLFGNLAVRRFLDPKEDGAFYGRVVRGKGKVRAFGLKHYLTEGAKFQVVNFKNTRQKQAGVEAVKNFILAANFKPRLVARVMNAVDELLTNAMFDAPADSAGNSIYAGVPRTQERALEGSEAVEMHVGFDGQRLGISVVDNFGSLDRGRLFSHLARRHRQDDHVLRNIANGAGVGLSLAFAQGSSFVFVSERGIKTEAMVFFRPASNHKEFKAQFKFMDAQFYF